MESLPPRQTALAIAPGFFWSIWSRLQSSSVGRRLAKGAFWSLVGAVINRGLYLVVSILAARIMGKQGYGQFSFIQSTSGMVASFAGFGLGLACSKHVAEFRHRDPLKAGRILALSGIWTVLTGATGGAVMLVFAPWFAQQTASDPTLVELFRISALMVFFGAVNGAQTGILTGFEAFRSLAVMNCISGAAGLVLLAGGAWVAGVRGAVWGIGLSMLIAGAINALAIRREAIRASLQVSLSGCLQELHVIWNFGLPIVLAMALVTPVYWFGQAVLTKSFGFAAQAEFTIGAQWRTAASWLPGMLTSAYLPILSSMAPEQKDARRRLMASGLMLSGGIAVVIAMAIAVLAEVILHTYGKAYLSGAWVLRILALVAVFDSINDLLNQSILASGRAWLRLWANALWALLTVLGIVIVVPRSGAVGLAVVLCFTQALHLGVQLVLYRSLGESKINASA